MDLPPICRTLLAAALLVGSTLQPARAVTVNPIDPNLPLSDHAAASCQTSMRVPAPERATCFESTTIGGTSLPLNEVSGSGAATADLPTGTLRTTAASQTLNNGVDLIRSGGVANAYLYDTITILNIPFGQSVAVDLRMTVDGAFFTTDAINPNTQGSELISVMRGITEEATPRLLGATGITIRQANDGSPGVFRQDNVGAADTTSNAVGNEFLDPTDVRFVSTLHFLATEANPSFTFMANLNAYSGLGFVDESPDSKNAITDFGNTGQLELILPAGIGFTSQSGRFLIPEPASGALLGGAAAALILGRRRRSRG